MSRDFDESDSDHAGWDNHPDADRRQDANRPEYADFSVEDFPGGLSSCLEAMLMVADKPQSAQNLAQVLNVDDSSVEEALRGLQEEYNGSPGQGRAPRGFELRHTARGWQYANRVDFEPVVVAFSSEAQDARLSQAALEALAIIVYRQPITRAQVSAVRGVNSDGVIRSLNVRGLIHEEGVDHDSRAALLVSSPLLLDKLGLQSLDQLPSLAPFLPSEGSLFEQEGEADAGGTPSEFGSQSPHLSSAGA